MLKTSFWGLSKPSVQYENLVSAPARLKKIDLPEQASFLIEKTDSSPAPLKVGDTLQCGQLVASQEEPLLGCIAPVTGTVSRLASFEGDYGKLYHAVTVDVAETADIDPAFAEKLENLELENAQQLFSSLPGAPDLSALANPEKIIHTLVVMGVDQDLLIGTQQYAVQNNFEDINQGIALLKDLSGVEKVVLVVLRDTLQNFGHFNADVMAVDCDYPSGAPALVMQNILKMEVPAGQSSEDAGVVFLTAEAVAAMGQTYHGKAPVVDKVLTFIDSSGIQHLLSVPLGTPITQVLATFKETLEDNDRLIVGGPMTGRAIFSADTPVQADTDGIMVQKSASIVHTSEYPCTNCGDCVQICPSNIAVNMLVRFLEVGQYETAADEYDLLSCVDCGLCSFVCIARIPIFQYIRLGKHELKRIQAAEAAEAQAAEAEENAAQNENMAEEANE